MPRSAIVFLIDGLNPLFLSPHGCTWIDTPAVDRLAAAAVVFERAVTQTTDPSRALLSFLSGRHPLGWQGGGEPNFETLWQCRNSAVPTTIFSDQADIESLAADAFERVVQLPPVPETAGIAAEAVGDTHLARCLAQVLQALPRQTSPFLFVVHLTSLTKIWDAPSGMRDRYRDEEDPAPSTVTAPPNHPGPFDPDEILGITHAYAAQIEILDTCLGVLMEEARLDGVLENTMVGLVGQRGLPIGYSGRMGHHPSHLGGDALRIPLMIRFPDAPAGRGVFFRTHELVTSADVLTFVGQWLTGESGEAQQSAIPAIIDGRSDRQRTFAIACSSECQAILTPAWFLIRHREQVRLFVQPDDRWEVNPVQDRCRRIAEDLQQVLTTACTRLKKNEAISGEMLADELVSGLD